MYEPAVRWTSSALSAQVAISHAAEEVNEALENLWQR